MSCDEKIPGFGKSIAQLREDFMSLSQTTDKLWSVGKDGVSAILTPKDKKVEFVVFADKTVAYVKSAMGHPAMYELREPRFEGPARALLMDLDGTSVRSEEFWIYIIEQTTARLLGNPKFELEEADQPHVSGHSVSEHLQYCIRKYCCDKKVETAREYYFDIVHHELDEIMHGRGRADAFTPAPGLKDFLLELKAHQVKIGLVTSGLYEKAWPEIVSAFRTLQMGDPLEFYDAIISAGYAIKHGQVGTLGELAPKPHPWLYAETARVGLGIAPEERHRVAGMEDSGAGVVSVRLAGFSCIGIEGGNIDSSGTRSLCTQCFKTLTDAIPLLLG
ncbi:MAG: HAD family phosphatase [Candidatus Sumerlaeales bacterium]|nr:HAD family phosphatase [Candidatus Sumerlaeales bacterium]